MSASFLSINTHQDRSCLFFPKSPLGEVMSASLLFKFHFKHKQCLLLFYPKRNHDQSCLRPFSNFPRLFSRVTCSLLSKSLSKRRDVCFSSFQKSIQKQGMPAPLLKTPKQYPHGLFHLLCPKDTRREAMFGFL